MTDKLFYVDWLVTFVPLIVLAFWIGYYPTYFTKYLDEPVNAIVERVRADYFKTNAAIVQGLPAYREMVQAK